ncbi:MAG TPA: ATP-dependent Clp protease ATP-binding subunit ClpA, partial [Nevskiaceae bacterium]|nr:ATP-dependent Clp protease ATP-binding subunit ClpA [Nevskiaceae bacterium]
RVVDKFLMQLEEQLGAKHVQLDVDEEAKDWIALRGYDVKMGARPMARVIQENLKRPLAEELLFGKLANGGKVTVTVKDDKLEFEMETRDKPVTLEPV